MNRLWFGPILACLLVLPGGLFQGAAAAPPDPVPGLDAQRVPWEHLRYRAKSWAVELIVDMKLSRLPSVQAETALMNISEGTPLKAAGPETFRIRLDMLMDSVFSAPVHITNKVWFNPDDAAALGRFRLRRGEDDFEKTYRFADKGVFRHNREPEAKAETKLEPDQWSYVVDTFYAHDRAQLGCPVVTDRLLLIYIVSGMDRLMFDQPFSVCVFGKRQLHRVTLSPDGRETIAVDFNEKRPASEKHRRDRVEVLKIKLVSTPLASDLDKAENFSFLGLHKNIEICIDPESRLPLRISGDISGAASGDLKLVEAKLK